MIKKNILGIVIVILIAAAFSGGYILGKRSAPQMPTRMAMMGGGGGRPPEGPPEDSGQPPEGPPGNPGQPQPGAAVRQPQSGGEGNAERQQPTAQQSTEGQQTNTEQPGPMAGQRPVVMPVEGNPGSGFSGDGFPGGGGEMTEEMRAVIAKAREEGKSREEIQALIAQLREQANTDQPQQPGAGQPSGQPMTLEIPPSVQGQRPSAAATPTQAANTHEFYGTAAPSAEVKIQSKQGGTIIFLKGKEGDTIRKNEILARFDDTEQKLNLEKAKSSKNSVLQQVQQAESNLKAAQINLERNQQLFKDGLISQQQMDDLLNKLESARSSLSSANENVIQADTQITLLEKALENFVVRSPISGIINQKNYNLQEIYRASDILFNVVNIDQVYVNVDVPETYIKQIREGMEVAVLFNALGDQKFSGVIETILPSGTTGNRNFIVRVLVENPDHAIKIGMFANVEIELGE